MLVGFVTVVLIEHISAIHRDNYSVLGVRKMWHALYRDGIDIGREQTARLMLLAGVSGLLRVWLTVFLLIFRPQGMRLVP
ncbi:transposase-like protein [Corynebacterium diphtheriae]|nr:transposase-like protein [Corynebacterium diphtheriae]